MQMSQRRWNIKATIFFVEFGGRLFQRTTGIPMGTNCLPLLAGLFLYLYESECIKSPQSRQETPCTTLHFAYRYIDDVLSLKKMQSSIGTRVNLASCKSALKLPVV